MRVNIFPGQQTAVELGQMALEDSVGIFILITDDPDMIRPLAEETIPAALAHVARGRKWPASIAPAVLSGS